RAAARPPSCPRTRLLPTARVRSASSRPAVALPSISGEFLSQRFRSRCEGGLPGRCATVVPTGRGKIKLSGFAPRGSAPMRRLMLLRHAKSDGTRPGARDHERTLGPRGREAAPRTGAYMVHHDLLPDLVICSTATRARETWDLVAKAFARKPEVVYEERIYEAGPNALFDVVKETKSGVHALLLTGHNPGMHEFAQRLIASGDTDARAGLTEK